MLIVILGDAPKVISMLPSANHVRKPVEHANQDLYCFLHDLQLVWQTHDQVIPHNDHRMTCMLSASHGC